MSERLAGGIIAAGEGRRLREGGWRTPKPLVPVAGVPLMESVIRNLGAAGITPIVVIVNEDARECVEWAVARFAGLDLRFIVRTTASSLESFLAVASQPEPGPLLIATVDAWCPPAEFAAFVEAARRRPPGAVVLAMTPLVADERPLWGRLAPDGRVIALGGEDGDLVTAGFYLMPESVRRLAPPPGLGRLREYLAWLVGSGAPVYGEVVQTVVDVDRPDDIELAESLLPAFTRWTSPREGAR